jgi:hypothetical protein
VPAYGVIHDDAGPVAFVKEGHIYQDSSEGELIGYEEDGKVLDLQRHFVGLLQPVGADKGTSVIRQLLKNIS